MTCQQNTKLLEAKEAILKIKDTIDMFTELKREAVRDNKYEECALLRDKEKSFNKELLSLFEIKIKNK